MHTHIHWPLQTFTKDLFSLLVAGQQSFHIFIYQNSFQIRKGKHAIQYLTMIITSSLSLSLFVALSPFGSTAIVSNQQHELLQDQTEEDKTLTSSVRKIHLLDNNWITNSAPWRATILDLHKKQDIEPHAKIKMCLFNPCLLACCKYS